MAQRNCNSLYIVFEGICDSQTLTQEQERGIQKPSLFCNFNHRVQPALNSSCKWKLHSEEKGGRSAGFTVQQGADFHDPVTVVKCIKETELLWSLCQNGHVIAHDGTGYKLSHI